MGESNRKWQVEVAAADTGSRLDRFLPGAIGRRGGGISRATLQDWIREGHVLVNGKKVKPRHPVAGGDLILIDAPEEKEVEVVPEETELTILHEDDDIVVVDKAPGMVVHPGSGNERGTLVNALLFHTSGKLCHLAGADRPGIVHRLDKDTSGCLVAAKSDAAYRSLVEQFSERRTRKEYLAVTNGVPSDAEGEIRTRIGRHPVHRQRMAVVEAPSGKEAATDYRVLASEADRWALLSCLIHTGRTHQIRVHLREILGCAILGDPIYAPRKKPGVKVDRLMLHAWKLEFTHPIRDERVAFEAAIPSALEPFLGESMDSPGEV